MKSLEIGVPCCDTSFNMYVLKLHIYIACIDLKKFQIKGGPYMRISNICAYTPI